MQTRPISRNRQWPVLSGTVLMLLATIGCGSSGTPPRVGELRTRSETIPLPDAGSVRVEINMAAGELSVGGGATDLLEAEFTYNVDELEPEVEYADGRLFVRTPEARINVGPWADLAEYRYEWDLLLSDQVPMEMKIQVAAGRADLDLGSLRLTSLDIETGASEVTADLSGSTSLRSLDVEAGAARVVLDLSGPWADDLDARINTGVGELTLRLSRTACVRVVVDAALSNVSAPGLTKDGDEYTNEACGVSEATLRIEIDAGIGSVNLEVEE